MSTDDAMTIDERYKYLCQMKKRYRQANRQGRGCLLDEMQAVTGLHRKSLIRLINGSLTRKPRRRERGPTYGPEVDRALCIIAEAFDYICAQRLTPNLVSMAQHLDAHGELHLSPWLLEDLEHISTSTVRRILSRHRPSKLRLPRKPPSPPKPLTRGIPMMRIPYTTLQPGHFEVDLVHHCGPSPSGQYVHSLQMVDVATAWSERRAVLGRSWLVMKDAFTHILQQLPFAVQEIHPDNGSEFFNYHLLQFWGDAAAHVRLSRSRPYHKNDNPLVEQKNSSLIRAYLGHERLDTVHQTRLLHELYEKMGHYYNLFQPVMRLAEKTLIPATDDQPARVRRRYDQPRTPFQRLCETDAISDHKRDQLISLRQSINPRTLRQEIYALRDELFSLPNALPEVTENVHLTLHYPWVLELPSQKGDPPLALAPSDASTYNDLHKGRGGSALRPAASSRSARSCFPARSVAHATTHPCGTTTPWKGGDKHR